MTPTRTAPARPPAGVRTEVVREAPRLAGAYPRPSGNRTGGYHHPATPDVTAMRRPRLALIPALLSLSAVSATAQRAATPREYPPTERYLMPRDAEIALARTAAPASIADRATIKVLGPTGFVVAQPGDNGNVCMVMRGFSAPTYTPAPFRDLVYDPTVRAPICFVGPATRTAMPYYELRTRLALAGRAPAQIAAAVESAYATGGLPRREAATFAYMWSAHQHLASGIDAWHPHVMIFVPNAVDAVVGGNPFGSPLPQLSDDAGTPFTVVVIPVDDRLAVRLRATP